jgi:hypothetical protein
MAKSARRSKEIAEKRSRKEREMAHPSGESKYGRKRRYLDREGGWGFDYSEPKPWK